MENNSNDKNKNTNNFDIEDLDDILNAAFENTKNDTKSFEDVVNLDGAIRRELYINAITDGVGQSIDGFIRFWNNYDNSRNIPVEERTPIKIYIDSPGGSLTDTLTMIDAIKMSKTPVWTIAIGCVYSGGFFSFICGHKRIAYPHSSFLYHEGSVSNGGTASQFRNFTDFYNKQLGQLKKIVLENSNITPEQYEKMVKDDVWYTAEEALSKGLVDEIATELI